MKKVVLSGAPTLVPLIYIAHVKEKRTFWGKFIVGISKNYFEYSCKEVC